MPLFVFDAYGTLFDVHAAIRRYSTGPDADRMSEIWRAKQLEYTWTLTLAGCYADFWILTERALDFALARVQSVDKALKPKLLDAYFKLDAFPDARSALGHLKQQGHKTAILSNGSPAMLDAVVQASRLGMLIDAVFSVEAVGIYKPHPKVYQLAADRLGIAANAIAFQSSNAWDAYAASAFGMQVVWCNRYGQRPERLPGKPDRMVRSLAELPALVGAP